MQKVMLSTTLLAIFSMLMVWNISQAFEPTQKLENMNGFERFKLTYNRQYSPIEDAYRKHIFEENTKYIEQHNLLNPTNKLGVTKFFDLSREEFAALYLGSAGEVPEIDEKPVEVDEIVTVDWAAKGWVSKVKEMGSCAAGYYFAAIGAHEGFVASNVQKSIELSTQQLVDCNGGDQGCQKGGWLTTWSYLTTKGVVLEKDYVWKGVVQKCKKEGGPYRITKRTYHGSSDEALSTILQKQSIFIAVDATDWQFWDFKTTPVYEACCKVDNHYATLVGYNTETQVFKVKNEWGTTWGDKGFIHLKKKSATCSIAQYGYSVE